MTIKNAKPGNAPMSADALVVSGWSAISTFGLGADRFAAGLRRGRGLPPDGPLGSAPEGRPGAIPGFTISEVLGNKGTRSMDRLTAITVATVGLLLENGGPGLTDDPESIGLVLGTGSGSVQSIMDFTRDSLTGAKPFHVDPARFPNTVMNRAAGQSAIWHGLRGPNATIAGGPPTGLLALNYTTRLQRCGHGDVMLCGAAEELSAQRDWLEWRGREDGAPAEPLGEGCAMLLLEHRERARRFGRRPLATVLRSRFAAAGGEVAPGPRLARCVTEAIEGAGLTPGDVRIMTVSEQPGRPGEEEAAALDMVFGGDTPEVVRCRGSIGDTSAASAAFQLAALLAVAGERPDLDGAVALVTSLDGEGTVGCALLRVGG